ncbi:MAG TPA: hypothetical protein PLF31_00455 [Candidatus Paceibacterota bacterium]|nr:hypothetical protein [Candidatus Paceibacterota bacterium]
MTSLAKFASVLVIAVAPAINAQGPMDVTLALSNPATAADTVLIATTESLLTSDAPNTSDALTSNKKQKQSEDIAQTVKAYFAATPILAEIAFCESTLRHYDSSGKVLRGKVDSADVGVMQINERYHKKTAEKLGLDLLTLEGNLAYAEYLYKKSGSQPWSASKPCWSKR